MRKLSLILAVLCPAFGAGGASPKLPALLRRATRRRPESASAIPPAAARPYALRGDGPLGRSAALSRSWQEGEAQRAERMDARASACSSPR